MNEREEQISAMLTMINEICKSYNVEIYPKETSKGLLLIAKDNKTGKEYAMAKEK